MNKGTLETVVLLAHRLGNLLRGSWHVVLDTLEQAALLLARRAIARPRWSPQSSAAADTELEEVERHCQEVLKAAVREAIHFIPSRVTVWGFDRVTVWLVGGLVFLPRLG